MSFIVLSSGYSGLAMLSSLRRRQDATPISTVVLDAASARAARSDPALRDVEVFVAGARAEGRPVAERLSRSDSTVLSLFWPVDHFGVPVIAVSATGGNAERSSDPLPWALAGGQEVLTLLVQRLDALGLDASACEHTLRLPLDEGLQSVAGSAAKLLAGCLDSACERAAAADVIPLDILERQPSAPQLTLPSRLNWQWPTSRIINLARAYGSPAPGAWTTWRDLQLHIGSATPARDPGGPVPPGTVLESSSEGLLVVTVDGAVTLTGLRDIIGPVDAALIACGDVLGGDLVEHVERLERRVRDLECIVQRLGAGANLL